MTHICDEFCEAGAAGARSDSAIEPHAPVRPADYPSVAELAEGLPWPDDPPFCAVCGHEMLTVGDLYASGDFSEAHAHADLDPQ